MSNAHINADTRYYGSRQSSHGSLNSTHSGPHDPLYDPDTRTGHPHEAFIPSTTTEIHGGQEKAVHIHVEHGFADYLPARPEGASKWAQFLSSARFTCYVLTFIGSLVVVGVNGSILYTYHKERDLVKWQDIVGEGTREWPVWPKEGTDMRPITAYISAGALNAIVMLAVMLLGVKKSFRYLESVCAEIGMLIVSAGFCALWVLLAVFLQYQALGNSKKHSFLTWTCTHTGDMFAVDAFSFANLCNLSRAGRGAGMAVAVENFLIFLTVLAGCCANRKTRGYAPVSNRALLPKWGA